MGYRTLFSGKTGFKRKYPRSVFSGYRPKPVVQDNTEEEIEETPVELSSRRVRLGYQLHPDTGEILGEAILPLPTLPRRNEAIYVCGESGSGKTVCMRLLLEHFAFVERRCVIVIDPRKGQYWSSKYPQDNSVMIEGRTEKDPLFAGLNQFGILPMGIPDLEVYVAKYDVPKFTWESLQEDWHASKTLNIRTSGLTPQGFFELGDKEPSGRDYQRWLELILTKPAAQKTTAYIKEELYNLQGQKSTSRSADSLINIFEPLCEMGVIADDGTDVKEMLHPPRKHQPGKVTVISLGTSPTDRRRNAILANILQQLFEYCNKNRAIKPVFMMDETANFCPRNKGGDTDNIRKAVIDFHMQVRALGITRVFGFQNKEQVPDDLLGENTPYKIELTKSLEIFDSNLQKLRRIQGTGLGNVHINGVGDPGVPDRHYLIKAMPCRTMHVD